MQCVAFDSRKRYTWALVQNDMGKHSSLFPPLYHLRPTHHGSFPLHSALFTASYCSASRALSEMPRDCRLRDTPGAGG